MPDQTRGGSHRSDHPSDRDQFTWVDSETDSRYSEPSVGTRSGRRIQKVDRSSGRRKKTTGAKMFAFSNRSESNFNIISCVVVLLVIGLVMVTSSSYFYAYTTTGDSMYFFRRQASWMLIGLVVMVLVIFLARMDWLRHWSFLIYMLSVAFCVIVLFFGHTANGSTRWLGVGSLSFQPSEFAKLAVAIYVSHLVALEGKQLQTTRGFVLTLFVVAVPSVFVAIENLTSGIIVAAVGVTIMFMGGMRPRHILILIGLSALVIFLVALPLFVDVESLPGFLGTILTKYMYRTDRIRAWLDPWSYALDEGYQTIQSLYAVGSGGFFGRGLGQSIQKLGYIPEAYNDIIFAIICEELGFFGAAVVVMLFGIFAFNGYKVSHLAPNRFSAYLSGGLVTQIVLQAILNIAVNTNMIPATGVSLPFISYGGSSMLFLMVSVGLIVNISMYAKTK